MSRYRLELLLVMLALLGFGTSIGTYVREFAALPRYEDQLDAARNAATSARWDVESRIKYDRTITETERDSLREERTKFRRQELLIDCARGWVSACSNPLQWIASGL